jgi:aminoglycoside/choline kinase family phosphotransferase
MTQASFTTPTRFERTASERLAEFLLSRRETETGKVFALTPDASTREYFRVPWGGATAVAAVYAERFDPVSHPYLDVTRLFSESNIPVPEIFEVDPEFGVVIQEDLGDRQLRDFLEVADTEQRNCFTEMAISLIARIQATTERASELGSVASKLAFDEEKLFWELSFFHRHYFGSLRREPVPADGDTALNEELRSIAVDLASRTRTLCHRDYHVANLMVDMQDRLRVVDYQDARMGPASYDLVSLLLDRQTAPPPLAEMQDWRRFFLEERRKHGLRSIGEDAFAEEFQLTSIQRGLKAVGTFSYQTSLGRGKVYAKFINPTLEIVLQAAQSLGRFSILQSAICRCLEEPFKPPSAS